MPESLKQSEIDKGQDPSVTKQWDDDVPLDKKMEDFGKIADGLGFCMMGTARNGIGVSPPQYSLISWQLTLSSSQSPAPWQ